MKKLKDMSMTEVLEEMGIFVCDADFNIFIDDLQKAKELEKIIESKENTKEIYEEVKRFFEENSEYIDKEKFVLVELFRMKEVIRNKIDVSCNKEELKSKIQKCKELIKGYKGSIIIFDNDNNAKIINLDMLNEKKLSNKNHERLEEISKEIPLDKMLSTIHWSDVGNLICQEKELGENIADYSTYKALLNNLDNYPNVSDEERDNYMKTEEYKKALNEEYKQALLEYAEYISVDRLLLTSIYRNLRFLDNYDYSPEKCNNTQEILKVMIGFVNEKVKLKGTICFIDEEDVNKSEEVSITAKELKDKIYNNFVNGQYIGDITIEKIRRQIFEEGNLLEMYHPTIIHLLKINMDELMVLLDNPSNLEYLMLFDMINDEVLEYVLNTKESMPVEAYKYLLSNGKINKQDILDLYSCGIIKLEQIRQLKEDKNIGIEEIAQEEELMRLYKTLVKRLENEEEFNKYLSLYKELKIKDTDIEYRKEIGQKLIEELNEDFEESHLKRMYKLGMIPIDCAIEWGGESITQEMFNEGILKPIDAKRLYKSNVLSIDMIKQVLRSSNLSNEDKLTLICSTFDSDEDLEIRMELIQCLNVDEKENKKDLNKNGTRRSSNQTENATSKNNAYITDPCMRWKLISLLDEEYSQEVCKDGYIIFRLPNIKDGTIIIEKMFKKSQNGVVPSYGNATYILSEEQFDKDKKDIVDDNNMIKTINLNGLSKLREEEKTDRLNHSSRWGNNIKEYFDVEKEGSIYDKEKIDEIDKTIKSIENSRTLK